MVRTVSVHLRMSIQSQHLLDWVCAHRAINISGEGGWGGGGGAGVSNFPYIVQNHIVNANGLQLNRKIADQFKNTVEQPISMNENLRN